MRAWHDKHRTAIIIFLFALFVRVALFAVNFAQNDFDLVSTVKGDDGYYELSQNIMAGNGFSFDTEPPYKPNPLRPPVWPYLISLFASVGGYPLVLIFELIMGSLIPVLGFFAARHLISEKHAGWVGFFLAFEPYSILLSFILYTETCFTFLFLIFVLFLFRYAENQTVRNAVWSGVFLGLATLVKPTVQFFPIIIPIIFLFILRKHLSKKLLLHLMLFVATFCIIIFPWLYRNYKTFDVWGMSAQPAFNLYVYLVPTVLALDNGTNFRAELNNFVLKDGFDPNSINLSNAPEYKEKAISVLREHKGALLKSGMITLFTFFTHDGVLTVLGYSDIRVPIMEKTVVSLLGSPLELLKAVSNYIFGPGILIIGMRLFWMAVSIFLLIGAFLYVKKEGLRPAALIALIMIAYFALTTAINGFGVNARFKIPVNAFILSFALYGFLVVWNSIKSKMLKSHA